MEGVRKENMLCTIDHSTPSNKYLGLIQGLTGNKPPCCFSFGQATWALTTTYFEFTNQKCLHACYAME
jgi:hypothetical protein